MEKKHRQKEPSFLLLLLLEQYLLPQHNLYKHAPVQSWDEFGVVRQIRVHQHHQVAPHQGHPVHVGAAQAHLARPLVDLDHLAAV